MANTRSAAKRARQAAERQLRNQSVRSGTRSTLRQAITALKSQNVDEAKAAYTAAIEAVSKAASKGALPNGRASRKISRPTRLVKKTLPAALPFATNNSK